MRPRAESFAETAIDLSDAEWSVLTFWDKVALAVAENPDQDPPLSLPVEEDFKGDLQEHWIAADYSVAERDDPDEDYTPLMMEYACAWTETGAPLEVLQTIDTETDRYRLIDPETAAAGRLLQVTVRLP